MCDRDVRNVHPPGLFGRLDGDGLQVRDWVHVADNCRALLAVLERELEVFDRGDRPDYEVIRAVISYFEVYPEVYHHPQEDLVFAKLRTRDCEGR